MKECVSLQKVKLPDGTGEVAVKRDKVRLVETA